ncbi:MAG: hypothetical protein LBQ43_02240 [Holosporales bacterium]|nr:hypothetical protein [Holosporales bacterium]
MAAIDSAIKKNSVAKEPAVKKSFVAKALLFDQLTESSEFLNEAPNVSIFLNKDQLLQSIQKELSDIFNARTSFPSDQMFQYRNASKDESTLSGIEGLMGLPNTKNIFPEGGDNWPDFASHCEMMIRLYETRIQNPSVSIESFDPHFQKLIFTVSGIVVVNHHRENVSFAISLDKNE